MSVSEAASSGDVERLRALLDAGGDPNEPETDEHWPPLLEAAYSDQVEAARVLLEAGADRYAPNGGGETPLLMAVQCGSLGVFRLLLEHGYQMDAARDNAPWMLLQAGGQGLTQIIRWLVVEQGLPVDTQDDEGCTALIYAAHSDHLEAVEELLRLGADPNYRDHDTETVLMWAADHKGNAAVLRALLQAGADVHVRNDLGNTALTWVISHGEGDPEMITALLDAGAQVTPDAFVRAAYLGFVPAVRLLLERAATGTVTALLQASDTEGKTALEHAINGGHQEVVRLLEQAPLR